MHAPIPVFAHLHGRAVEKFDAAYGVVDEGVVAVSFRTHAEDYRVYVPVRQLPHAQLILFDGYMLPHGIPRGGQSLDYEYGRHEDKFNFFSQKIITWEEEKFGVRPATCDESVCGVFFERSAGRTGYIRVTIQRQMLLLPKGRTAQGFCVKPLSLERQYVTIDAGNDAVQFRVL